MKKEELIALAKELVALDDIKGRQADLSFLKREHKRLNDREEDIYYEQQLTNEFNKVYEELAKKEGSLLTSTYEEKKAIIAKAKDVLGYEDIRKANNEMNALFDAFKKAGRCSKEQDDELWTEFKAIKDEFNKKRNAQYEALKEANQVKKEQKEAIIAKAKDVLNIENIKDASNKMDALMEEWKAVGFSGKDNDQALWEEFSNVRKEFSKKRKEHFENMKKVFEDRANKKEEAIKNAKLLLADSDFSYEEIQKVKNMRKDFEKIGFAGKDKEDDLYQRFNEVVKKYFDEMKFYK